MVRNTLRTTLLCAVLLGCTPQPHAANYAPPAPQEETVFIWHGLKAPPDGKVIWDESNFRVSAGSGLSFFEQPSQPSQPSQPFECWLRVPVTVAHTPVPTNGAGAVTVTIPPQTPAAAKPTPWTAVFDNKPEGHWSIPKDSMTEESGNKASKLAAAVFQATADHDQVTVENGSLNTCRK
jgi:hypothetical protein